ncbi:hypothetical protein KaCgl_16010 [Corynebacterium glutamicum]|nr:hypothetical protein KaCgl_16010 [Corynebacterium glutamicum]
MHSKTGRAIKDYGLDDTESWKDYVMEMAVNWGDDLVKGVFENEDEYTCLNRKESSHD